MPNSSLPLLRRITCPHCWSSFPPEDILWISAHAELLGDARLGAEQSHRFLPTRFNVEGNALDGKGFPCHELACPRCHLRVPRVFLEMEPVFISILGTPACGKSYFLAAMTWQLRQTLPLHFALSFADADTLSNRNLNEYEEALFLNPRADQLVALANLIRKTELQGEQYDTVMFGEQSVTYPRPLLFALQAQENHPSGGSNHRLARILCLYDNAGEHFLTGQDTTSNPVTHHLASSRLLLFLFDPTQDLRFQRQYHIEAGVGTGRTSRQEAVLHEAAARVRRYAGLSQNSKHRQPLIVVVTKSDAWLNRLKEGEFPDPWELREGVARLNVHKVEKLSEKLRAALLRVTPEVVTAAEAFAERVAYIPVSALGGCPEMDPRTNQLAIRPRDIRPNWVIVPLLYGMCRWMPGLVFAAKRRQSSELVSGR